MPIIDPVMFTTFFIIIHLISKIYLIKFRILSRRAGPRKARASVAVLPRWVFAAAMVNIKKASRKSEAFL